MFGFDLVESADERKKQSEQIFLPSKIIERVTALGVYPVSMRYAILYKIVLTCKDVECFLHHAIHPLSYASTEFIFKLCGRTLTRYRSCPFDIQVKRRTNRSLIVCYEFKYHLNKIKYYIYIYYV